MNNHSKYSQLVGVGLKNQHAGDILQADTMLPDFFEVHAENYFNAGGLNHAVLRQITERFLLSIHGTGLGLGNYCGIDMEHLAKFKWLIKQYQPFIVSEHLCFTGASVQGKQIHAGDLLPLVWDNKTLEICINNIDKVQNYIGRPILVENICHYIQLDGHQFTETEFLNEICRRTGCQLLVDINNVYINGENFSLLGGTAYTKHWLNQIQPLYIGQYHVAGSSPRSGDGLLVDDHGTQVQHQVWDLLQFALQRNSAAPILVEWDTQVPAWPMLATQADKARQLLAETGSYV